MVIELDRNTKAFMIKIGLKYELDSRRLYVVHFIIQNLGFDLDDILIYHSNDFRIEYNSIRLCFDDYNMEMFDNLSSVQVNLIQHSYRQELIYSLFPPSSNDKGPDILATIFWFLTRYEEYIDNRRDEYGRFLAEYSQLNSEDYLIPIVDDIILRLAILLDRKINFQNSYKGPRVILSHDIDHPSITRHVPILNWVRALGGDLVVRKSLNLFLKRFVAYLFGGNLFDPANIIDWILLKNSGFNSIFFYIATSDLNWYNTFVSIDDSLVERQFNLIRQAKNNEIGIHPSLKSSESFELLSSEISKLSSKLNKPLESSRMHYVKYNISKTFNELNKLGIRKDYTMLFPDALGWKTGSMRPFKYFDLFNRKELDIVMYTTCFMDVTASKYLGMKSSSYLELIDDFILKNEKYAGVLVILWHNSELMTFNQRRLYARILEKLETVNY